MNTRRHFLTRSAAAAVVVRALDRARQSASAVKIGVLHPVTGALAYSGQQCRLGALLAIEDINQAGGIKSLGGAPLEAVLGDAQSRPEAGSAEVEKMAAAGVSAVVGVRLGDLPGDHADRRATGCPMWSTWAWPTRSSSAG